VAVNIKARRMSGEMCTSLGNGFTNYMVFLFVHSNLGNHDYDCVIEGDDCLGVFRGITPTSKDYANLGFTIKIELHRDLRTASFCGLVFGDNHVVVTDPIKVVLKTGWASAQYAHTSDKSRLELLKSKALSVAHQYPAHPILSSFARWLLRCTAGIRFKLDSHTSPYERELFYGYLCSKIDLNAPVELETRLLVQKVFKVDLDDQLMLESYFDGLNRIEPIWHPALLDYFSKDMVDYDLKYVYPYKTLGEDCVNLRVSEVRKNYFLDLINAKIESQRRQSRRLEESVS